VLLSSINKKRMPSWWRSKRSGWTSTYAIMNMPSLSKIALHLHTLDLAVAQCIANRTSQSQKLSKNVTSPKHIKNDDKKVEMDEEKNEREIFDVSISQTKKPRLPTELQNISLKERMETVIRWAKRAGIPLHDGATDDDCHICDNGGFVLCCEFCVNVAHPECIGHKGKEENIDWDFVCAECTQDIYNAFEIAKDD